MRNPVWDQSIALVQRIAEARTFERYTGMQDPWLFAHEQTNKAIAGFANAYRKRIRYVMRRSNAGNWMHR